MTHYDEYYHWRRARELYDPHKYDYLHAEEPNNGEWGTIERGAEWTPTLGCTCDACFLWGQVRYVSFKEFHRDYARFRRIMDAHSELDRIDTFFLLMTSDEEDCIF